jgi:hypothetical protein
LNDEVIVAMIERNRSVIVQQMCVHDEEGRPGFGDSECPAIPAAKEMEGVGLPTVSTALSGGSPLNLGLRFSYKGRGFSSRISQRLEAVEVFIQNAQVCGTDGCERAEEHDCSSDRIPAQPFDLAHAIFRGAHVTASSI